MESADETSLGEIAQWLNDEPSSRLQSLVATILEYRASATDMRLQRDLLVELTQRYSTLADQLDQSEKRYRSIISAMSDGVILLNSQGQVEEANRSAERLLGIPVDAMLGRSVLDLPWTLLRPDGSYLPADDNPIAETVLKGEMQRESVIGILRSNNAVSWFSVNSQQLSPSKRGAAGIVVATFHDVTYRMERERMLTQKSETDELTGIANRAKFAETIATEVARAKRYGYELSLIMFDIDRFKHINDTYGHDHGDEVLSTVVSEISPLIRHIDLLARWGGDEFMIILPHTTRSEAVALADRIRRRVRAINFASIGHVTCSFGITALKSEDDVQSFLKKVDEALYMAKRDGRNIVRTRDE